MTAAVATKAPLPPIVGQWQMWQRAQSPVRLLLVAQQILDAAAKMDSGQCDG